MNLMTMQQTFKSMIKSYFHIIFLHSLSGLTIAVSLIVFHFEHLQNSASDTFIFDHNLTTKCKLIAKTLFVLQCYNPVLSMLVYFETYRTLTSLHAKKNCNKQYSVLFACVLSSIIGMMQATGIGDVPSPLCLMKQNVIEISVTSIVQGTMCCLITALNIALYKHMEKTRKATGRKQSQNDRLILIRFSVYNLVMIVSFVLDVLRYLHAIHKEAIYLAIVIFKFTLTPFAFPITFVLSAQQFRSKVKGMIKRH